MGRGVRTRKTKRRIDRETHETRERAGGKVESRRGPQTTEKNRVEAYFKCGAAKRVNSRRS